MTVFTKKASEVVKVPLLLNAFGAIFPANSEKKASDQTSERLKSINCTLEHLYTSPLCRVGCLSQSAVVVDAGAEIYNDPQVSITRFLASNVPQD